HQGKLKPMSRRVWGLRSLWDMWGRLKQQKRKARQIKSQRLRLEPLEHRHLMAVRIWTGAGGDTLWSDPANWDGGVAISTNDDLVFPAGVSQTLTTVDAGLPSASFSSITFGGSGYVVNGNALTLTLAGTPPVTGVGIGVTGAGTITSPVTDSITAPLVIRAA